MRKCTVLFALVSLLTTVTFAAEAADDLKALRDGLWNPWRYIKSHFERNLNKFKSRINTMKQVARQLLNEEGPKTLVFPGTKWCGRGHTAKNYNDVGRLHRIDKCCRAHDKCQYVIYPRQRKYGITNKSKQTLVSCGCDVAFQKCLKNIRTWYSYLTGHLTFNVIRFKCFTLKGRGDKRTAHIHQKPFRLSESDKKQLGYLDRMIFELAERQGGR